MIAPAGEQDNVLLSDQLESVKILSFKQALNYYCYYTLNEELCIDHNNQIRMHVLRR